MYTHYIMTRALALHIIRSMEMELLETPPFVDGHIQLQVPFTDAGPSNFKPSKRRKRDVRLS